MPRTCTHLNQVPAVTPSSNGCGDWLRIGDSRVHLCLYMICGNVGGCDDSKRPAVSSLPRL
jgi:hypothetical protein